MPESGSAVARVQGSGVPGGMAVRPELIRSWFTRHRAVPGPKIIFRPVIDLEDHQHVEAYEVPDRLKEAVNLRDGGCVFPWCHRPAYRTDCDHTIAWKDGGKGGPTCTCNLASLCRFHHRAKTHADNHTGSPYTWWTYESLGEGKYLWRGPKGAVLLRTNSGVQDLTTQPAAHTGPGSTTDEAVRRIAADLAELRPAPSPDDENLEFPPPRPVKREPSWRKLIDWYDGDDDPPAANSWRHALRRKTRAKEHPLASLESGYASLANSAEGNIKSPLVDPANPFGSAPYVGLRKTSR